MSQSHRDQALGIIETRGLLACVDAADAMVKAAEVGLARWEEVGGGLVTLMATGDLASVTAAVQAAVKRLQKVGGLLSAHVIPRPYGEVWEKFVPLRGSGDGAADGGEGREG